MKAIKLITILMMMFFVIACGKTNSTKNSPSESVTSSSLDKQVETKTSVVKKSMRASTPQELTKTYKKLFDERNADEIMKLFHVKDAAPMALSSIPEMLKYEFDNNRKIISVDVYPIDEEELNTLTNGYPYQGKLLVPTVDNLSHTMNVTFKIDNPEVSESSTQIHMGKTGSGYLFTLSKLVDSK